MSPAPIPQMPLRHTLFLVLMNIIWGAAPIAIKIATGDIPPFMAGAARFVIISMILLPLTRIHPGKMKHIGAIALTAGAGQFALLFLALGLTTAVAPLAVVLQLGVPFATVLSIFVLGEVVRWRRWTGIGCAFLGVALIGFDPVVLRDLGAMGVGTLTALVASLSIVLMRTLKDVGVFHLQAWIAHVSWPILLGLALAFEPGAMEAVRHASWIAWAGIFYVALGSSLTGHAGMFWMLQRYEISQVAPFLLLAPSFTIFLSAIVFHEPMTWRLLVGGALTLLGVAIINLRELRVPQLRLWS